MQTTKKLFALLIAGTLLLSLACTKNGEPTYTIEYRIENADDYLRTINYMDASNTMVGFGYDANSSVASKTITVTKPFVAELDVYAENRSLRDRTYQLVILVDGVPMANKTLYIGIFDYDSANLKFALE